MANSVSYLSGSIFLMVSAVFAATFVKVFVRHLGLSKICIIDGMSWFARCVMHRLMWFSSTFKHIQDVLRIPYFYPIFCNFDLRYFGGLRLITVPLT